jgi:hypothetical protein
MKLITFTNLSIKINLNENQNDYFEIKLNRLKKYNI